MSDLHTALDHPRSRRCAWCGRERAHIYYVQACHGLTGMATHSFYVCEECLDARHVQQRVRANRDTRNSRERWAKWRLKRLAAMANSA